MRTLVAPFSIRIFSPLTITTGPSPGDGWGWPIPKPQCVGRKRDLRVDPVCGGPPRRPVPGCCNRSHLWNSHSGGNSQLHRPGHQRRLVRHQGILHLSQPGPGRYHHGAAQCKGGHRIQFLPGCRRWGRELHLGTGRWAPAAGTQPSCREWCDYRDAQYCRDLPLHCSGLQRGPHRHGESHPGCLSSSWW